MRRRVGSAFVLMLPALIVVTVGPTTGARVSDLTEPRLQTSFAQLIVDLCALVAIALSGWLLVLAALTILAGVLAPGSACDRLLCVLTPRAWRTAVLTLVGVSALIAPAAHASDGPSGLEPSSTSLSGLPLPDRPSGGTPEQLGSEAHGGERQTVRVRSGDTLWQIAKTSLRTSTGTATDARIRRACDRLYATNRAVIGTDPDLIFPDMVLRLPQADDTPAIDEGRP